MCRSILMFCGTLAIFSGCLSPTSSIVVSVFDDGSYNVDSGMDAIADPHAIQKARIRVIDPLTRLSFLNTALDGLVHDNNLSCIDDFVLEFPDGLQFEFQPIGLFVTFSKGSKWLYLCNGSVIGSKKTGICKIPIEDASDLFSEGKGADGILELRCQRDVKLAEIAIVASIAKQYGYQKFNIATVYGRIQDLPIEEFYEDY